MWVPALLTLGILGALVATRTSRSVAGGSSSSSSSSRPASFANLPIGTYVSVRGRTERNVVYTGEVQEVTIDPMIYRITRKEAGPNASWTYGGEVNGGLFGILPGPDFTQADILRLSNATEWAAQSAPKPA